MYLLFETLHDITKMKFVIYLFIHLFIFFFFFLGGGGGQGGTHLQYLVP